MPIKTKIQALSNDVVRRMRNTDRRATPEERADGFNVFFTSIGEELADKIPGTNTPYRYSLGPGTMARFKFRNVTSEEIRLILSKLKPKNSSGHDNISSKLLKLLGHNIAPQIAHIINMSLSKGHVPNVIKLAKVVPIFKAGDSHDFSPKKPW